MLLPAARHVHIVPGLHNCSLLSIGQLCDSGYEVLFTKLHMSVLSDGHCILQGHRSTTTRLWHVTTATIDPPLPTPTHYAAAAIGSPNASALVAFAHAALFSPVLSTLESAVLNGYLVNFPGLTLATLRKHPPHSIATIKGHLDQTRQNVRSTRVPSPIIEPELASIPTTNVLGDADFHPECLATPTHMCFASIIAPTGQIYTDQTGKFILPSSTGNNYIMILYDYDSNYIFVQPFHNRTASCLLAAYKALHQRLCKAGLRPKLQRLDNECSTLLKDFLDAEAIDFQLVPPAVHRRNAAERAIRTFQNHFIAGLCSVDKHFPLHLWDQLLVQAELTLNLLRGSRINPKLSAWAQVNGTYDYNRVPLAPPGCRVLVHAKPQHRTTWAPHALDGWYVGPAVDSYRCYRIWMWDTRSIRICDTVSWFPTKVHLPCNSSTDLITTSLQDIAYALLHPTTRSPVAPLTATHKAALQQLLEILSPPELTQLPIAPLLHHPNPSLRVPGTTTASTIPLLPDPDACTPFPVSPALDGTAQPLRVLNPNPTPNPTDPSVINPTPNPNPHLAGNPNPTPNSTPRAPPASGSLILPAPPRTYRDAVVLPSPLPPSPSDTYDTTTVPKSRRRRKNTPRDAPHASQPHTQSLLANCALSAPPPTSATPLATNFCFHGTAINPDNGKIAGYRELLTCSTAPLWATANGLEIGRLFQGLGPHSDMPTGTNCCFFIHKHEMPSHKRATYIRIVCADRPEKNIPQRVRWTAGGDRVIYTGNVSTKTADLTTAKCLFNSTISTPNGRFMTLDLSDFYLESHLAPAEYEYVRIPIWMIPPHIQTLYNLAPKIIDGHIYAEIRRGMYGLPQAGKLANDQLARFLLPHHYLPCPVTPGLWMDTTSDLMFTLVVDDFGVRYTKRSDVDRLLTTLRTKYRLTTDWTGSRYIGLTLTWDYEHRTVDLTMPGYIVRALQRFTHSTTTHPQHAPHAWTAPSYGARQQFVVSDVTPVLDLHDKTRVQEILGTLLYYARAIDCTMLPALGTLATQQATPTVATLTAITHLLNYCATHPEATLRFTASDMVLHVESDASYLSETRGRSRAAGIHFLSCKPVSPPSLTTSIPPLNGAIYVHCQILKEVVSSAAEAELAALFHNGKEAYAIRTILVELGHPQPSTRIVTDNSTASGIANDTVRQKRSKAMDMRYYWVRDRVRQGQFLVYWKKGSLNRADYFTKHHPASHHMLMRPHYLHCPPSLPSPPNYYACLASDADIISTPAPVLLPESVGEGVLISAYDAPYMRRTNHTGAATRLGTCVSANNDVLGTAIE